MIKPKVGVYRTVYPLYSETFISEQLRSYTQFQPVVICRESVQETTDFETVTLNKRWRPMKKFGFTALGMTNVFDNFTTLKSINLIHAHFAPDAVLALSLAKKLQVPLVATCHGSDVMVSDSYLLKSKRLTDLRYLASRTKFMRETSLFVAVSDFLRNAMIERGYPADKIVRHYIGVDTTRLVPRRNLSPLDGNDFILSVARHTEVKGIDVLLKAFAQVARLYPKLRLVQIGGGALTNELKTLTIQLGIEDKVDFLGPQPPAVVLSYLQTCKTLVLSSRQALSGAEESFGLVLTEASACGVPCIGTRVGGIPEAVVDGETGFVIDSENIGELAEKITLLISDQGLAQSMGQRGREMVCDAFDIRIQTKKLENFYAQLS